MRYSRRFTDFRRSPLYRELKRRKGHKAISVYQNLVDTICEKYIAGQGNGFTLVMHEEDWLRDVDLHHNAKDTFRLVLEIASSNGAVVYKLLEGKLSINIPNIVEIADEYAKRMERDSGESPAKREKIKDEKDLSSSSNENDSSSVLLQRVRAILSKNAREIFAELPAVVETYFEKCGDRTDVLNQVVDLITAQFTGNEKQQQKGQQLIERIRVAYQSGLKGHAAERIVLSETSSARRTRLSMDQKKRSDTIQRLIGSDAAAADTPKKGPKRKSPGHINGAAK